MDRFIIWGIISFVMLATSFRTTGQEAFSYERHRIQIGEPVRTAVDPEAEDYREQLTFEGIPSPGIPVSRADFEYLKNQTRKADQSEMVLNQDTADRPEVPISFVGNPYNSRVPNDNDIAVSDDGYLISVINSTLWAWDLNKDSIILRRSLGAFAVSLGFQNSKYDPRVVYDPINERFIVLFLNGFTYQTSQIIVAFSTTTNPLDPWNFYALPGNPLQDSTWSDYPYIATSENDLYISVNTFTNGSQNNSGYVQSTFWQVDLESAYNGDSLVANYYTDIKIGNNPIFTTTAVKGGSAPYGPGMFLLANDALSLLSNNVYLLHVNDRATAEPELEIRILESDQPYSLPPEARQKSGFTLETNDGRVMGAFMENNRIHYVSNTRIPATGNAGIYYTQIDQPYSIAPEVRSTYIYDTLDLAFGNISYAGNSFSDHSAIISSIFCNDNTFAGFGAHFVDSDGRVSNYLRIREGSRVVNVLSGPSDRWGDYTGSQRLYGEPGSVWTSGSYAPSGFNSGTATFIAKIVRPESGVVPEKETEVLYFPNPTTDRMTISFEMEEPSTISISIIDYTGRSVLLLREYARKGINSFSFDTTPLRVGAYFLVIEDENGNLMKREQIIKN
jgi:hypothetical protein